MYKLIIVEDEPVIRKGLEQLVEWGKLGFEIIGSFAAAEDGITTCDFKNLDVILTDIRLVEQTGLDLIRYAKKINSNILSVIISSYEEFNYARQAIELEVVDYLTKPINYQKLHEVFAKIKLTLDKRIEVENIIISFDEKCHHLTIYKLLHGLTIKDEDITQLSDYKNFVVISITNVKYQEETKKEIDNLFIEGLTIHSCLGKNERINVLIFFDKFDNKAKITEFIEYFNNIDYIFGISKIYKGLINIPGALVESEIALEYQSLIEKNVIYFELIEGLEYADKNRHVLTQRLWNIVKIKLEKGDFDKITAVVFNYFSNKEITDLNIIKDTCLELVLHISNHLIESDTSYNYLNLILIIKYLLLALNIDEVKKIFAKYLNILASHMKKLEDITSSSIKIAINYIENNYMNQITLSDVANICYLHPAYFSSIFKQETKLNFTDYLTELRINKAKILLSDKTLKIADIAEMTGFTDSKYFAKKFKQITSLSPSEYRNKK